jgi:soluble lytic murein transglycosylase
MEVSMKFHPSLPVIAAFAGLATGLAISTAWSEADLRERVPSMAEFVPETPLDPLRGITRAELRMAMEKAQAKLAAGQPWAAWVALRGFVTQADDAEPAAVLMAARAAGGWGGWTHVRTLLDGRTWLDDEGRGEGWMLLGRAHEARGSWGDAADAYRRYAAVATGEKRGLGHARQADALRHLGRNREAAAAFAAAARDLPAARDWMIALQAKALAAAGDADAASLAPPTGAGAPARVHLARAAAAYATGHGDAAGALERLDAESRALAAAGFGAEADVLLLDRAQLLEKAGRNGDAIDALRRVAADPNAAPADRARAATELVKVPGSRTVDEHLARVAAYEAATKPGMAAKALRSALAAGLPDDGAARLRLGRLLFDERDLGPARVELKVAAARLTDPEQLAEAELLSARALSMSGQPDDAVMALRKLVDTRPGTAASGTALFILADQTSSRDNAIALYRRASAVTSSASARDAAFRLGDRVQRAGDADGAARAWEEYVARYPRGEETAQAAYQAGVIHERAGRADRARAMYSAAIAAEPVSYYAVRAADRLGIDPLERTLAEPHPWDGLADDPAEGATALRRLDALTAAGLDGEWAEEADAQMRRLDRRPVALLTLAEGLRDRGHTIEAIRLGRKLLERRGGEWDQRLLRVVFPLPYRQAVMDEAERVDLDPYLLAGLIRQESSWDHDARSRVGATGLAQIMPSTGKWLAKGTGVDEYDPSLLTVPEINLRMGARYLADQMDRYHGARDLALIAYNAGPSRADRWRSELNYGGDLDTFRDRIPFEETRGYVKVVLRNAAVYRRLYGDPRSPGLAQAGD